MIIHKEQVEYVFPDGKRGKKLLVSYVGKNGGIEFLQYPIPKEQMFEWNTEIQGMKTLLSKSMILRRSASRLMIRVSR